MRILFDQNVPRPLKRALSQHFIARPAQLGWQQLENGDLLSAAEQAGFDLMITADQNIVYQQNLAKRMIALIVLGSNDWRYVRNHLPAIVSAVDAAQINSYTFIEVPLPPRTPRSSQ